MKQLGIIGLGAMGAPMAAKLQAAGFELFTTVRSEHSRNKAEQMGICVLDTSRELAEHAERILLMVSNYDQCRSCLEGTDGLLSTMKVGTIIVSSTIAPGQMKKLQMLCPEGIWLLDAPVSGGVTGAEQGRLVTMAAGETQAVEACKDIFSAYSKKIVYVGTMPGQGQMLKAVNQMLVGIHIAAAAEAANFSEAMGIDLQTMLDTISDCAGNSNLLQSRIPKLAAHDYTSHAALETLEKDTKICMDLADEAGIPCYLTEICHELYMKTPRSEKKQEDACAVIRMYQKPEKECGDHWEIMHRHGTWNAEVLRDREE